MVLRIDAKVCHVEVDGERRILPLAGKLFDARTHEKRPLAVGDLVLLAPGGTAIDAVVPRRSQLLRRAASEGEAKAQVLAANVSLVLAVASVAEPPLQTELVDAVLAAAAREPLPHALVLTKADLDPPGAARWADLYRSIGYRVLVTSTATGFRTEPALAELATLLQQNRSVVCGLSGAGKSSLLNAVVPGLDLRIGDLNHIRQGRHTTTHTELIPLPGGGHVLDTPGVRSFHLFHAGAQELQFLFPELASRLPQCAFRSCLHDAEGDCAVRRAVDDGSIAPSRYRSYLRLLHEAHAADPHSSGNRAHGGGKPRGGGRRRPR